MSDFRTLNQTLLAKVQAATDTEETPTVGSDAIKVEGIQYSPNFDILDTDAEHTGSLDVGNPIVGGGSVGKSFATKLKGSGTGGTAPESAALYRGCGMAETTLASDLTGTAQAGATSTITLAASGPSTTDDAYKGMVIELDGGTGTGQSAVITAYNGTTKVATVAKAWTTTPDVTTTYTIPACVLYRPASTALEVLTLWSYQHGTAAATDSRLRRVRSAAGNMSLEIATRGIAQANFTFTGVLPSVPTDVTHPGAATFDTVSPVAFIATESLLGGSAVKFNRFTIDLGNEIAQADDPAAQYGYDSAGIIRRKTTGTISPNMTALTTRDNVSDFFNQTPKDIIMRWGSTVGNRVSLLMPQVRYTGGSPSDNSGFAAEEIPFQGQGADAGLWMCFH